MADNKGEDKSLKSPIAEKEEKILEFWNKNQIFQKTLEKKSPKGEFVFYEGPPTANAKPALHHLEARVFKDIIPRFKTMNGFHVRRKGGWDTHGLPVELQIEKKLGLKSKKEIEVYGIEKFNRECKDSVFQYISDWEIFTDRIGYWVDKKDAYYTFDTDYIESVWNILKTVNDKKLLYKDYKVLPWCPRCGTALSSHELAQGYQEDKDLAVTVKFKIKGVENGYFLAWTTTPWTLPGNVALAVGKDITYVEAKVGNEVLVLAKDRLSIINEPFEILAEHKGSEMLGMEYEPLYNFLAEKFNKGNKQQDPVAFEKSYKVYSADFVNTEDGTGIVHTAVMYGQDDFVLGTKVGLPKHHLVNEDGHFSNDMDFLSGRFVKDEEVAVDIIKDLAYRRLLFKKEKHEHSYPHCWRCDTPLIYYARDSWYIAMSKLRDDLVKENESINWEPNYIKEGRFGEWLREIKDWAISRERYWGTPLPIWQNTEGIFRVIGSIDELKKYTKKSGNKYFVMRHSEAESNVRGIINYLPDERYSITDKGRKEAEKSAEKLKSKKITKIFCSKVTRAMQTAEIVKKTLKLDVDIVCDDRLIEIGCGDYEGKLLSDYRKEFPDVSFRFDHAPKGGETLNDIKRRMGDFVYEIEKNYKDENILIVSHGDPIWMLDTLTEGYFAKEAVNITSKNYLETGEVREILFVPLPHNENYELDLHKPFIDLVELVDEKGVSLTRVKEVLDVWFDSGAMPFAQDHYPFSDQKLLYPADFISEAIDQTRGWFYTLHAIGVLMGKGKAYKNVICLGHILDSQGKKMSKSVGNIVDPWTEMSKYGVDALRFWMYSVNQPGDSKNFDEKTVDEIVKKVFNPAENILSFYDLYKDESVLPDDKSKNVLDRWIISRLNELISLGTKSLYSYKVFEATRVIRDFINDFSTWYIRRSRDRFKSDNEKERKEALSTTRFVFLELSKYMAPFTPFFAESSYQRLHPEGGPQSVHLCQWPEGKKIDKELLEDMRKVREVVTKALELRQKAGLKVRQPLATLTIPEKFSQEFLDIISDEVNVKKVKVSGTEIKLDTDLTVDLKNEGIARDVIRVIQDTRKTQGLNPNVTVSSVLYTTVIMGEIIEKYSEEIKKVTKLSDIEIIKDKKDGDESLPTVTFK